MNTDEKKIRWAVDLVNTELERADLDTLRKDFREFFLETSLIKDRITAIPLARPLPRNFSIQDFSRLQSEVKKLFDCLLFFAGELVEVRVQMALLPTENFPDLHIQGPTIDIVLLILSFLFLNKPSNQIKRCEAENCNKILYRYRGQMFCSRRCTNREMSKRKRESDRKKELARQRKKYEKKVRGKLGQKVKIKERTKRRKL